MRRSFRNIKFNSEEFKFKLFEEYKLTLSLGLLVNKLEVDWEK